MSMEFTEANVNSNARKKDLSDITEHMQEKAETTKSLPYYKLFRFSTWLDKILISIGTLCALICGISMPFAMILFGNGTGYIVEYASTVSSTNLSQAEKQQTTENLREHISTFAINMSIVGAASIALAYISNTLLSYTASRQAHIIRKLYLFSVLNQDISWYDAHKTGDFASVITECLAKIEDGIGEKLSIFLFCESVFVSGIIFALIFGWELTLICFVSLPVTSVTMGLVSWLSAKFAQKEMDAYAGASTVAEEAFSAIRTVIAFEGQKVESERYTKYLDNAMKNNIRKSLFSGVNNAIMWFCLYGSYALSFWYGVGLIIRDKQVPPQEQLYTSGNVVGIFWCCVVSSWFFGIAAPYLEVFSTAQGAAVKIFSVIDSKPTINLSKGNGKCLKKVGGNILFSNVRFEYPSRLGVKILDGLNLSIKSGEKIALVGSSGCGKSTIVQLIQRFYDPVFGEVYLDGHNIKEMDLKWLRNNIGIVSQEPALFATSIYENIRYGNQLATNADIERAARKALAHEFISKLPQGYHTVIGEKGAQLSGGQKQRIAIARALVRKPVILLLDEATSALDTTSEAMVQAALDTIANDCTTITVAHRLSTVRNADRILVLSDGKVAEEGSHQELIAKRGLYYNLVTSQEAPCNTKEDSGFSTIEVSEDAKDTCIKIFENSLQAEKETEDAPVKNSIKSVVDVMKVNKPEWLEILVGCLASILTGAALPVYSIVFGDFIGVLSEENDDILRTESNLCCLYFLIIGIVTAIATFLQIHMFARSGEKLTKRIRRMIFESILNQEIGWFDLKENNVGALCIKLSNDAANIQGASGQCIGTLINSLSTFIISSCLALLIHWKLALAALAFSPLILISVYYEQKIIGDDMQTKKTLENSAKIAMEAIGSIRTVASLGCEELFCKLYNGQLLVHHETTIKKSHFRSLMVGLSRGLMFFCYAGTIYYGTELIISTNLHHSVVFKVSECVIVGSWSIGNAVAYSPNFQKGLSAAHDAFRLLKRVPKIRNIPNALKKHWSSSTINYNDIHFSYPARPNIPVLKGLNMTAADGKRVALVGPSGCGKSTLIQLLERFYDPDNGEIQIDGNPLPHLDISSTRSRLGIVSQEPNLFNRTIYENIVYGAVDRKVSMDEVIDVSRRANIYNFISSLPLGYDTNVGERATHLSGGQKQRIAIARALIRNPKVLLLDEATSALDNENEKIVQEALDAAKTGRTCIIIAHRITTIQDADIICVVNDGKVAEIGKHAELLNKKGLYHKLYQLQSH